MRNHGLSFFRTLGRALKARGPFVEGLFVSPVEEGRVVVIYVYANILKTAADHGRSGRIVILLLAQSISWAG